MRIILAYPWAGNQAGAELDVPDAQANQLIHDGFARLAPDQPTEPPQTTEPPDFSAMNVDELRAYADQHDIDVDRRVGKAHLVKALTDITQSTQSPAGDQPQES